MPGPLLRARPARLPTLTTVPEVLAEGELRAVYEDTKAVLRVPWMGVVTMAFAHYPAFYAALWGGLRDLAGSVEFREACTTLRAAAEDATAGLDPQPLAAGLREAGYSAPELERIRDEIEVFSEGNMPYLLIATAARLLLEGHALSDRRRFTLLSAPQDPGQGRSLVLMEMHHADPSTRALYRDIMAVLGLPFVNTDYRALARWPSYFALAWQAHRPTIETEAYGQACARVHATAVSLMQDLPNPGGLTPDRLRAEAQPDTQAHEIADVVRLFQWLLPGLIVNVAAFRQQLAN